ncbi:branched-chain amino acid ABC transporter permease [Candidatus Poriferisodalis sp.]|uniref:branched-chain amino acid ABC transporter permease n=1 Tax=Candidatus Poriferisodalis sp. TaxID=3101277 RepID=UPI003C700D76
MTDSEQPPEQGPEPLVFHLEPLVPAAHAAPGQSERKRLPGVLTVASLVVIAVLAVIVPFQASSIFVTDFTELAAFCLVFAGLWLLTHRMGLLSIGHGALTGCGAYAALHAANDFGLPLLLMPAVGFVAGCAVGALLGVPALRLPKAYLALLTLSAAVAFPIVLRQLDGPLPVTLDGEFIPPAWTGIAPNDEHIWEFWLVVVWVVIAFWLLHRLLAGPIGRALVASRDEPIAAAAFGVSVYRLRLAGVSVSSGLAGLAGGLMLISTNFNDQSLYQEVLSIKLFALAVAFGSTAIGGSRLIMTVPAAAVLVILPVWLGDRPGWVTQGGWIGLLKSEAFLYAVLLLVAAYVRSRRARAVRSYGA